MTPSATDKISSNLSIACGLSNFAITGGGIRLGAISLIVFFTRITSSGQETNEIATASTPFSSPKIKSSLSFSVKPGILRSVPGKLTPLFDVNVPPSITVAKTVSFITSITSSSRLPSSSRIRFFGSTLLARLGTSNGSVTISNLSSSIS